MKKIYTLILTAFTGIILNAQLIVATGNLSVERYGHQSQMLANGKVVAFGGDNANFSSFSVYSSAEIYNPATGTWSATGSMHVTRDLPGSVLLTNGNILVIGGADINDNDRASCEIYNAAAGTWAYTDSMATPRSKCQAVVLNNSKVLVVGGDATSTCELYDQTAGTWSATGSMNIGRNGEFSMSKMADGRVLVCGGNNTSSAEIYDPSTGVWTNVANAMTDSRSYCTSILMSNNKVLIAGGGASSYMSAEVFNPTTSTFTATGLLTEDVVGCPMVNLANGNVLIYGLGDLFSASDRKALQVYSPSANGWFLAGTVPINIFPAEDYTIHTLQTGKILIVGGNASTGNGANQYCDLVNPASIVAGIDNLSDITSIAVYPNPTNNIFTINAVLNQNEEISVVITDVLGNAVMEINDNSTDKVYHREMNIENLSNGVYFVTVQTANGKSTTRIVKN